MQLIRYGLISEDRGRFVNVLGRYLEILDFISKQQLSLIDGMVLIAGRTKLLATAVLLKKNASATISKLVQTAFTPVSFQQPQTMHAVMQHEFFQQLYAQKEGFYDRIPERGIRFMFGKGSLKKNGQNALSPPLGTLEKYVLASGLHRFLWD